MPAYRLRVLRDISLVFALVTVAASCFYVASAAAAVQTTSIPGYRDMVVDPASGRVFVSTTSGTVVALNADGTSIDSIYTSPGAGDLIADGGHVYVARCGASQIDSYDAATLALETTYELGAAIGDTCSMAKVGSRIWFNETGDGQWNKIRSVDVVTHAVSAAAGPTMYKARLVSDFHHPNQLVAMETGLSPYSIDILDVTTTTPALVTHVSSAEGSNIKDLQFAADGNSVFVASGSPYNVRRLAYPALTVATTYPTTNYPDAVAPSADGAWIFGGSSSHYGTDIFLFSTAGSQVSRWETSGLGTLTGTSDLLDRGLLLSPSGGRLYAAVVNDASPASTAILTIADPTVATASTTVAVTGGTSKALGAGATITGVYKTSGDPALTVGRTITVALTRPGSAPTTSTTTVGANGAWSLVLPSGTFDVGGSWGVTASATAFSNWPSASASTTITVPAATATTTLVVAGGATLPIGSGATMSGSYLVQGGATLAAGRTITISLVHPDGATTTAATATASGSGSWSVVLPSGTFDAEGAWTITATTAAFSYYPAASATVSRTVPAPAPPVVPDPPVVTPPPVVAPPVEPPPVVAPPEAEPPRLPAALPVEDGTDAVTDDGAADPITTTLKAKGPRMVKAAAGCRKRKTCPKFTGTLTPAVAGLRVRLVVERLDHGTWKPAGSVSTNTLANGSLSASWTPIAAPATGSLKLRARWVFAGDDTYDAGSSAPWAFSLRR